MKKFLVFNFRMIKYYYKSIRLQVRCMPDRKNQSLFNQFILFHRLRCRNDWFNRTNQIFDNSNLLTPCLDLGYSNFPLFTYCSADNFQLYAFRIKTGHETTSTRNVRYLDCSAWLQPKIWIFSQLTKILNYIKLLYLMHVTVTGLTQAFLTFFRVFLSSKTAR